MKAKLDLRMKAIALREQGYSLNEISESLHISKSSASLWTRNIILKDPIKDILFEKRIKGRQKASAAYKAKTDLKLVAAGVYARDIVTRVTLSADTERLICSLLYWCEGVKIRRSNSFGFTNSDPNLVKVFLQLLRRNFSIDERKLRITLHIHEYHNPEKQLQFWSNVTNIPISQCHKPYLKPNSGSRIREGYEGCITIRYFDTEFARNFEAIAVEFLKKGL